MNNRWIKTAKRKANNIMQKSNQDTIKMKKMTNNTCMLRMK